MYSPEFEKWFNERFDYVPQPPPEIKSKLYEAWQAGIKVGVQVGDAKGTLDMLSRTMKSGLIPYRKPSTDELVLHRFIRAHGLSSPIEFLV